MSTAELQRVGEVIEASSTDLVAQCYELYQSPPLGSLVKTVDEKVESYGIVYHATTSGIEPGRRPIARGRDETSQEEVYHSSPQLLKLLRTEFSVLIVGHRQDGEICHYLPPGPARIHGFVYLCPSEEVKEFSQSLAFLGTLFKASLPVSGEELIAATLRQMSRVQGEPRNFLVSAGKELAALLGGEINRLKIILERIETA